MRVRFEWTANTPLELPVSYHHILQGIIYQNLRNVYGYSEFVHEEGYKFGQRKFRMFCFSHIMGRSSFRNGTLAFTGGLAFEVSSPDVYLIRTLAERISDSGLFFLKQHYEEVEVFLSDYEVESEEMIVRTLSPITVYATVPDSGKTIYDMPEEEEFSMAVNDNFQRKYAAFFGVPAEDYVRIIPLEVGKKDKCVTKYKGIYITGYGGIYRIAGHRRYLNFLYQAGVGGKNAQGFGMVEMIE